MPWLPAWSNADITNLAQARRALRACKARCVRLQFDGNTGFQPCGAGAAEWGRSYWREIAYRAVRATLYESTEGAFYENDMAKRSRPRVAALCHLPDCTACCLIDAGPE
jgi:hypothetical protein